MGTTRRRGRLVSIPVFLATLAADPFTGDVD